MSRRSWVAGAVASVVLAAGLWAFEPWRAVTSSELDEALPSAPAAAQTVDPAYVESSEASAAEPAPETQPAPEPAPEPALVDLAAGDFETAEHDTTGRARIVELADGSRFVRLEDLATSDGPDLHVWVTDQPSGGSWGSYDDGRFLRLGELKATHGNHNYAIPADADLGGLRSVVIWCDRFDVAFASAPVTL